VVAIDTLPLRIEIASRKAKGNFRSQVGRAEDLSAFADGSFDVVYLNSVFHWVTDKPKALSEIHRVLKPGGRLGLNSANSEKPHQSAAILREILADEGLGDPDGASINLPISPSELRRILEAAGFRKIEIEPRVLVDFHEDADAILELSRSSSFGNSLSELGAEGKAQLRDHLSERLEAFRTPDGIRLERYLTFATARKG